MQDDAFGRRTNDGPCAPNTIGRAPETAITNIFGSYLDLAGPMWIPPEPALDAGVDFCWIQYLLWIVDI